MVVTIAVRAILQRMSLCLHAATEVTMVNGQSLYNSDNFIQLEDKNIETLCRVIRRPGGINQAGNVNQEISVSAMAEAPC